MKLHVSFEAVVIFFKKEHPLKSHDLQHYSVSNSGIHSKYVTEVLSGTDKFLYIRSLAFYNYQYLDM